MVQGTPCERRPRRAISALLLALILSWAIPAASAQQPLPDLRGRWAILQVTSQIGVIPLVGERIRTSSTLALLDIEQEGLLIRAQEVTCSTTIDNGTTLVKTEIPDAFIRSLPGLSWTATLEPSDAGLDFVTPWITSVNGARLDDPESDSLPTRADDPRVVDQDGDGKPGLTVHVSVMGGLISGDVYVVQRDRSKLSGAVLSPDEVDGLVEWSSEQSVLGASSPLLLGGTVARPDPIAEHSYFRARRVDDATSCVDLRVMAGTLFGK